MEKPSSPKNSLGETNTELPRPESTTTYYSVATDDAPDVIIKPSPTYSSEPILYMDSYADNTPAQSPKPKLRDPSNFKGEEASPQQLAGSGSPLKIHVVPDDKGSFTWNDKFQLLLDSLPTEFLSSESDFAPVASFCWDLLRLSKDFVHLASLYGKIIISEKALAENEKTIKPAGVGGFAGGRKYLKRGILFKFPQVDDFGIYGGVDEWAAKAGGHELKGLMGFKSAGIRDLRLPLLALIDYRGYRLCAVSLLPINKEETLVYGSGNGGKTVLNSDPVVSSLMDEFGRQMNLKPHAAGRDIISTVTGPADIEVHQGTDGRYYVLDLARVFPPEAPTAARNHLFNLLRPEFVQTYSVPLSSDAFSRMVPVTDEARLNNEDVRRATQDLMEKTIPGFVKDFEAYLGFQDGESLSQTVASSIYSGIGSNVFKKAQKTLIEELHRRGINIRHLGIVRMHASAEELRLVIIVEMISRVLKVNLRKRWRQQMEKYPASEMESFKHVTAKYLNLALGSSDRGALHWAFDLIPQLQAKFPGALTKQEKSVQEGRTLSQDGRLRRLVTLRVAALCGIEFSAKFTDKIAEDVEWFNQERPIPELHVTSIDPVIKTTNTIPYVEGLLLLHSARRLGAGGGGTGSTPPSISSPKSSAHHQINLPPKEDKDVADRTWILKSAARKFKEAVRSAPGGRVEILALSYVLYQRATMNPTIEKAVRHLDIARHKLQYLLRTYPDDRVAFVLFADVVQLSAELRNNVDLMHQAISHYLQHLSTHRNDAHASYQCGKSYLSIYYFSGKKPDMLQAAHNMAKAAVEFDPNSGEAYALLARTSSLLASKERDLAAYTLCEEAFQKAHLLCPNNVYVLYQWGVLLLRKAAAFDSVDALLSAALKLKTAIEREPKIDHYNSVRECIAALEDKLSSIPETASSLPSSSSTSNLQEHLSLSSSSSFHSLSLTRSEPSSNHNSISNNHHQHANLTTSQHASVVAGWIRTLRQALERWQQQHQHDHGGESHMIDWEDIDIVFSLGRLDLKFMFKARWHPNKNSLSQSTGSLFTSRSSPGLGTASALLPRQSKDVAVKVLKLHLSSPVDRQRFENEIKIYAHLKGGHQNVSRFYGISFDEEHMIIVGEFLEGGVLPDWLKLKHPKLSESEGFWSLLCSILQMIAQGISYLHDHYVIWNNVQAHQCLVSKDGVVKICHFHSSTILQQDDPLSELAFRNEIVQLGLMALNIGLGKFSGGVTVRAAAHGSSNVADQIHAAAAIPAHWPEFIRDLITAMLRTDLEPRLTADDVADRIKRVLDV